MKKSVFILLGLAFCAALVVAFASPDKNKKKLENLSGTYADPNPYPYGQAFGTRVFSFDKGKWTLLFTLALDPNMNMKVFEFRTYGAYKVLEPSSKVAGAYNAVFMEEKKFVTLRTEDEKLVQAFGFTPCNLKKDVEADISSKGCAAWKPVSLCNEDHDLLSMDAQGRLYFGERPADNDMCTAEKRPTRLTPPVEHIQ